MYYTGLQTKHKSTDTESSDLESNYNQISIIGIFVTNAIIFITGNIDEPRLPHFYKESCQDASEAIDN